MAFSAAQPAARGGCQFMVLMGELFSQVARLVIFAYFIAVLRDRGAKRLEIYVLLGFLIIRFGLGAAFIFLDRSLLVTFQALPFGAAFCQNIVNSKLGIAVSAVDIGYDLGLFARFGVMVSSQISLSLFAEPVFVKLIAVIAWQATAIPGLIGVSNVATAFIPEALAMVVLIYALLFDYINVTRENRPLLHQLDDNDSIHPEKTKVPQPWMQQTGNSDPTQVIIDSSNGRQDFAQQDTEYLPQDREPSFDHHALIADYARAPSAAFDNVALGNGPIRPGRNAPFPQASQRKKKEELESSEPQRFDMPDARHFRQASEHSMHFRLVGPADPFTDDESVMTGDSESVHPNHSAAYFDAVSNPLTVQRKPSTRFSRHLSTLPPETEARTSYLSVDESVFSEESDAAKESTVSTVPGLLERFGDPTPPRSPLMTRWASQKSIYHGPRDSEIDSPTLEAHIPLRRGSSRRNKRHSIDTIRSTTRRPQDHRRSVDTIKSPDRTEIRICLDRDDETRRRTRDHMRI